MTEKFFGTNVSVVVFHFKPNIVTVEDGLIVLSLKLILCREELFDAHERKLNFASSCFFVVMNHSISCVTSR